MELIKLHNSDKDEFIGYAESRIGGREENQDSFSFTNTDIGFLITVCDGMGGGPGGKTASTIAATEIIKGVKEGAPLAEVVKEAVEKANAAIIKVAKETPSLKGMGSTATVLLLNEQKAVVAHVGDSRVYQLRRKEKVFRTFDHSVVFDMVRQNIITEEQARLSAQSNIITRALGVADNVEVDISELAYEAGDLFLLCTDGIHGTMPEKELLKLVTGKKGALGPIVDNIATTADDIGRKEGGGHDNLTIAVIQTKNDSKQKPEMPKKARQLLTALTAVCMLSIILNVAQLFGIRTNDAQRGESETVNTGQNVNTDSVLAQKIKIYQDSIEVLNKVINQQKDSLLNKENKTTK